jgi:hypothetical protein
MAFTDARKPAPAPRGTGFLNNQAGGLIVEANTPSCPKNQDFAALPDQQSVDPRLVFLHRAHARLILFEDGLMSLDEAVFGLFDDYCPCSRERRSH